jgi:respiratory burst oxidase
MPNYHRVMALNVIFMGCVVHSIPQIVNYATQELAIEGGPVWTFGDGLATKQLLITGILLFFLFLAFFLTTLGCIRRTALGFRLFWSMHICGIVCAIPLLIIHGTSRGSPITLYFTILPVCLYLVDSLVLRRCLFSTRQAEVIHLSCTPARGDTGNGDDDDEHVVKLVIRNPDFRFTPGQYAEIKIPQLARHEWHPFTIANAPNLEGSVVVYIKAVGRWTSALYDLVSEASVKGGDLPIAHVGVRGPYGAPAQDYLSYRHILVIGSGIGVTPLLSIWKYLVSASRSLASEPKTTAQPSEVRTENEYKRLEEENDEQRLLESLDVNSVDVVRLDRPLVSFRARAAYYASCLESMTVNICLFIFSLTAETIVFCVWLFEFDRESALLQIIISVIALIVFSSKMILSLIITYRGRYLHSFVFALESCIVVTDAVALISSATSYYSPSRREAIFYFAFFAAFVVLHAIRVFHIFYATARPPAQHAGGRIVKELTESTPLRVYGYHVITLP